MTQFVPQGIEKKRVDDLVDILDAGVVHASIPAGQGVDGALEQSSENGRRDIAPIKIIAGMLQQQFCNLCIESGDFDVSLGKQSAIDVRESSQVVLQVWVALFIRGIKHAEQADQCFPHPFGGKLNQIIVEHGTTSEYARVFGIEAEYQTYA